MAFHDISAFAATLPREGRLLGFDAGEKTLGLALSDVSRRIATPMETLPRGKFSADAEKIARIVKSQEVCAFVLGYPLNMDGSEGPRCQSVRALAANLERFFSGALPALLWDERMSTMAVTRTMLDADLSRARRAELVDKMAAAYILQGVLDAMGR